MALQEKIIEELIAKVTENALLEKREIDINTFISICQNYLNTIDQELLKLQNQLSLQERVSEIGKLMHEDDTMIQTMLILSHAFQVEFNNFLNRQVYLTWISESGSVFLGSQKATERMYSKGSLSQLDKNKEKVYRSYIKGRAYNFNPLELSDEMQKLQQLLIKSAKNKRQVFKEGKRRYNNTTQKNKMNYPSEDQPGLYWAVKGGQDGDPKHWSKRIASAGYIGEGYVKLLIKFPEQAMYPVNGPTYDLSQQKYIQLLAKYSLGGDNIPGILRGDITATDDGNVQLAIKQGKRFHTASIAGNIGIAKAFIDKKNILINQNIDTKKLRKKIQKISQVSYNKLYDEMIKILNKNLISK